MVRIIEQVNKEELDYTFDLVSNWMANNHYEVGMNRLEDVNQIVVERTEDGSLCARVTPSTRTIEVYEKSVFATMESLATKLEMERNTGEYNLAKLFD